MPLSLLNFQLMLDKSVIQNENVQERLRVAFLVVGFFTFARVGLEDIHFTARHRRGI